MLVQDLTHSGETMLNCTTYGSIRMVEPSPEEEKGWRVEGEKDRINQSSMSKV